MTFVYDIYVNFQNICYDFYEWNKKDKIMHVKKIPIFEITEESFGKIIINDNKIDNQSLELIKNKAEIFKKKKKMSAVLFTNNKDILAVQFQNDGKIIKKSFLLLEEENTILKSIHKIDFLNLELTELEKKKIVLSTRNEIERTKYLLNHLSHIEKEELDYLYFECFGKKETNLKLIEKKLKNEIMIGNEKISSITYNFFKLIGTNS